MGEPRYREAELGLWESVGAHTSEGAFALSAPVPLSASRRWVVLRFEPPTTIPPSTATIAPASTRPSNRIAPTISASSSTPPNPTANRAASENLRQPSSLALKRLDMLFELRDRSARVGWLCVDVVHCGRIHITRRES